MKALILGLDGATFDVIDKLTEQDLPCLKSLITHGTRGPLQSAFPPATGPAWVSLATGKNPGKTGVFGFVNRINTATYETRPLSSAEFKRAGPFWDYLCHSGLKIGIWNYPRLYPPYSIRGFMTGGLGCSSRNDFTYPGELKEKLLRICRGYTITVPYMKPRYSRNPSLFITDVMKLLDQNQKALDFLLGQDLDLFIGVISASDFTQHYMWKFFDETHPMHNAEEAKRYKPAFLRIWQRIDGIVESVLAKVSADTDIFIVSDHGFGPHKQSFYVNSWLESEGYLVRKGGGASLVAKLQSLAVKAINQFTVLSPRFAYTLIRRGRKYRRPLTNRINMEKTVAFAGELDGAHVYINSLYHPHLHDNTEYERTRQEIADRLRGTLNKLNTRVRIHFPENLYSGEFVRLAPDIQFELSDFECSSHNTFNKPFYRDAPSAPGHSGTHRMNGIFIAHGPDIKQGTIINGARIQDLAPTILHLMGLPVPDDMDGRVLMQVFRDDSDAARLPVRYQKVAELRRIRNKIGGLKTLRIA